MMVMTHWGFGRRTNPKLEGLRPAVEASQVVSWSAYRQEFGAAAASFFMKDALEGTHVFVEANAPTSLGQPSDVFHLGRIARERGVPVTHVGLNEADYQWLQHVEAEAVVVTSRLDGPRPAPGALPNPVRAWKATLGAITLALAEDLGVAQGNHDAVAGCVYGSPLLLLRRRGASFRFPRTRRNGSVVVTIVTGTAACIADAPETWPLGGLLWTAVDRAGHTIVSATRGPANGINLSPAREGPIATRNELVLPTPAPEHRARVVNQKLRRLMGFDA